MKATAHSCVLAQASLSAFMISSFRSRLNHEKQGDSLSSWYRWVLGLTSSAIPASRKLSAEDGVDELISCSILL